MEIKRQTSQKPEFCEEKKPIIKKKKNKKSSCNTCSGEGHTIDSKEALTIIEKELTQWQQYL